MADSPTTAPTTTTAAPPVATNISSTSLIIFEVLMFFIFIVSGFMLRQRRRALQQQQAQRYQRVSAFAPNAAIGLGAATTTSSTTNANNNIPPLSPISADMSGSEMTSRRAGSSNETPQTNMTAISIDDATVPQNRRRASTPASS